MSQLQLRPRRQPSGKSRRTYREPDSDTDLEFESVAMVARPTRSSRRVQTYREQSSAEDDLSTTPTSESESPSTAPLHRNPAQIQRVRKLSTVRRSQRTKRKAADQNITPSSATLNAFKRQKLNQSSQSSSKAQQEPVDYVAQLPINTRAPPWQSLEYNILVKIMCHASYPLYTSAFRSRPSVEWLVGVSRLCKSFHEAATAALLHEPPLLPVHRAHGLLQTLSQEQAGLTMNYQTKIRSLNVEVKHLLVKKSGIDIENLLQYTPLLADLRIFHWNDEMVGKAIWAEPAVAHFKWSYGNLFELLDQHNIRLKSFEWNGRFQDTLSVMPAASQRPCLSGLEAVSVVNLNFTDKQEEERARCSSIVTKALISAQTVQRLEFRNCTILDSVAMTHLPLGLKSLKIINCLSLTSEGIGSYLMLGGNKLRSLHLEGNQVMDLAFMPKMAELCPQLEDLLIDLSYEDCSSYRDRNPLYDELLPNGSPSWPPSLTSIIVGPLRSLDLADAEDFYDSLINAASQLPYLRVLSLKTILGDASWRDRATLRSKWRPIFEHVFAANKPPITTRARVKPRPNSEIQQKSKKTSRKSARIQELEDISVSEDMDDGVVELVQRLSVLPQQNRCEIVEFELSDQRPAQEQFREDDFLDSEPSDDGEWNGRDQTVARSGYAW